jgi:predicted Fe-S protein YdhL (DUF1289 family)
MEERPCIGECNIGADRICSSCKMTVQEIRNWFSMEPKAQKQLKAELAARK